MKIHCIGNSHINIFSGKNEITSESYNSVFKLKHVGPVIAFNFYENHYPNVLEYLNDFDKEDYVMLIVGEVDCRWHLLKQSNLQNRNINDLVKECVDRFCGRAVLFDIFTESIISGI